MELVYLWVEDYKNIHKQGFNFSPRFTCDYDGKELTIDENDDYIENFFGENINVTAIVGKNGSGKSSILEFFLLKEQRGKNNNFIFIYIKSSTLEIYTNKEFTVSSKIHYNQYIENIKYDDNNREFKMIFSFAQYLTRENHPKVNNGNDRVILLEQRSNISDFLEKKFNELLKKLEVNNYDNVKIKDKVQNKVEFGEKIFLKDLSFGETLLISLFINISKRIEEGKLNIFFLDEITLPFHPNWEKKIIKLLIEIFHSKNIHFILTSHSPFLLSDIPKQNIIFLDKDEKENCKVVDGLSQTFGANIHTLLSDSFFMEDGLMGEFAKGKINEIKKFYEKVNNENKKEESDFSLFKIEYEKNKIKFEQIHSIIGEPFLKTIVKNQLEEIESILFGNKAKEMAIERFVKEFDKDDIMRVLNGKA
jgi:predicted ATP-binding protein involved in virulence